MICEVCKDLDHALERAQASYMAARSAAYYRVRTDFAAKKKLTWSAPKLTCMSTGWCAPSDRMPTLKVA